MASLRQLAQGRTSVFVARRLSTVQGCDRIYVVAEGRVAEQGTHQQLMAGEWWQSASARRQGWGWGGGGRRGTVAWAACCLEGAGQLWSCPCCCCALLCRIDCRSPSSLLRSPAPALPCLFPLPLPLPAAGGIYADMWAMQRAQQVLEAHLHEHPADAQQQLPQGQQQQHGGGGVSLAAHSAASGGSSSEEEALRTLAAGKAAGQG